MKKWKIKAFFIRFGYRGEAIKQLFDLAGLGKNEFLRGPHKISSAKDNFIVAIDMANHKDA